jgi:hypothetical protein
MKCTKPLNNSECPKIYFIRSGKQEIRYIGAKNIVKIFPMYLKRLGLLKIRHLCFEILYSIVIPVNCTDVKL